MRSHEFKQELDKTYDTHGNRGLDEKGVAMLKKYGFPIKTENYIQDEWRTTKEPHEDFTIGFKNTP